MPVNSQHPAYSARIDQWKRCRDVYEGSDAVKGAGKDYLPMPGGLSPEEYKAYKARASFYGAFSRSVGGYVGSIARKEPIVKSPTKFQAILDDITGNGIGLLEFIKKLASEVIITGRAGLLTEYDEKSDRPRLAFYKAEQVINWFDDGGVVLEETVAVPDPQDRFKLKNITQWREIAMVPENADGSGDLHCEIVVWRTRGDIVFGVQASDFYEFERIVPNVRGKLFTKSPFSFVSQEGSTSCAEKPPLLDLADVVLSHYMTSADLENGRHWTACPTLWVTGAGAKEEIRVGGNSAIVLGDDKAKVGYAEFTGAGLSSLEKGLEQKEKHMAVLGAKLFGDQKAGVEAAETARLRNSGEDSLLAGIVTAIEEVMETALQLMASWMFITGKIDLHINRDFVGERIDAATIMALVKALMAGGITTEMFLSAMQAGEMLPPDTDIAAAAQQLKGEADAQAQADAEAAVAVARAKPAPAANAAQKYKPGA